MNLTMQQPLSYPLHTSRPRLPFTLPWSSAPFRLPTPRFGRFPLPYPLSRPISQLALSQQSNLQPGTIATLPSYSKQRFRQIKQSASYPNQLTQYGSLDTPKRHRQTHRKQDTTHAYDYRPSRTKSISDFDQKSLSTSIPLSKAESWHMINHGRSNLSVTYAHEMKLNPKRRRKHLSQKNIIPHSQKYLAAPLKRNPSMTRRKRRPKPMPETGTVRISTLDEMPINKNQTNKKSSSINNDRLSMKGSISNSIKRRPSLNDNQLTSKRNNKKNEQNRIESDIDSLLSSTSSSHSTFSSLQERLNGSLRNDPLITAAMEDFRQLRRSSSQNTSLTSRARNLSRDSHSSESTLCSSRRSRSRSQSSFTSVERSEIREIIKTIKTKGTRPLNVSSPPPPPLPPIPIHVPSPEPSIVTYAQPAIQTNKPKKSCITEELDREFNKLRALDPDQELTYVTPSSICKRKKTLEKPASNSPPPPTFNELLRQVQLRPIEKSTRPLLSFKESSIDRNYEHPLHSVPVPRSSPIPTAMSTPEINVKPIKHEYATPIKKTEEKSLPKISHFQPMRNLTINRPTSKIAPEKPPLPPPLPFNWPQYGLTNPMPTTFQPRSNINHHQDENATTTAKENIYAADIDVCLPLSTVEKNDDDTLQAHLDNHTILTDDFYTEFGTKQKVITSSLADDFALLFKRKHKHENPFTKRNQRCSIM